MATLQSTTVSNLLKLPSSTCTDAIGYLGMSSTTCQLTYAFSSYTWSTKTGLITGRCCNAGSGTQNAALVFGGSVSTPASVSCVEAFNGSTWSSATGLITARHSLAGVGTQNAALSIGGTVAPAAVTCVQAYNGSTWSVCTGLITARTLLGSAGTTNAALAIGGGGGGSTENFNGTSWSVATPLPGNNARMGFVGTQTAAVMFGGTFPGQASTTVAYNGNGWTTLGNMINANLSLLSGAGTTNAALSFGGFSNLAPGVSCTEIFTGNTWSVGSAKNVANSAGTGAGTQTGALSAGGCTGTGACTESYCNAGVNLKYSLK